MMPVLVDAIGHSIECSLSTPLIGEEARGSSSFSYLPKFSFQHVGGTDFLPKFLGKGIVVKAVIEILFHTPNCSFLLYLPLLLPIALNRFMASLWLALKISLA